MRRWWANRTFLAGVLCGVVVMVAGRFVVNETTIPDWLVMPLVVEDSAEGADAIVVLGAGVVGECAPNLNGVRRVLLGVRLFRSGRAPLLVFTGGAFEGTCPVAVAMAQLAREIGVPDASIRVERASRNTWENGARTAPILRGEGVRRVLLVTDRLHMRRAAGVFRRHGFDVELASVPIYEGHVDNVSMLAAGAREAAALAYYRMRGWLAPVPASDAERRAARNAAAGAAGTAGYADEPGAGARGMEQGISHPEGPIVVLGASYAGGWDVEDVNGVPVLNAGVSGQQSFEMLSRFDRDVAAAAPRAVILWGFINDVFRAQDIEPALARVRESYTQMIARARAHGIEPILATEVTVRPPDSWTETITSWIGWAMGKESYQDRINRHVMEINRWLVDLGRREGLLVLDLHGALADEAGRRRREFIERDGSHITPEGYAALTDYAMPILARHFRAAPSAAPR